MQVTCVMSLNQCPFLPPRKGQQQNVCKNLTKTVDVFDIVVNIVGTVDLYIVLILITRNEFSDGTAVDTSQFRIL